jgi:hypothetical protein
MNEELRIVIRAITEQAKREIQKVKKELNDLAGACKGAEEVGDAIESIGKKALIATTGITALVAGLVKLGNESLNIEKIYNRLESGFASTGQSVEQAHAVFKGLYRFLGEEDAALEAANLLAQLTDEMEHQEEWIKILQGAYASLPSSINVESLIESINETANVGKVVGQTADALNWLGVSEDAVNAKLETLNSTTEREAYLRQLLLGLYEGAAVAYEKANGGIMNYYESQLALNEVIASTSRFLVPLLTEFNYMAATLLQVLSPAIEFVVQVLIVLVRWIAAAASAISSFFGGSSGQIAETANSMNSFSTGVNNASSGMNKLGKGIDGATKKAKELKKLTMGFDELNVINPANTSASGGSGAGAGIGAGSVPSISVPNISGLDGWNLDNFEMELDEVKEKMQGIFVLAGIVASAIAAWKILDIITNPALNLSTIFKTIGGYALIISGALLLVHGYSDAWANGINWGNMLTVLGGIAAIIGGLYITMGAFAAQIGLVAGGVALLVLGVKDFIDNGATVQNTILIIGGAIAVAVGLATAGVSVLVSAIVGVVAAVGAFTAALILEEPAIMSVKDAEEALAKAKEDTANARWDNINAIDAAEAAQKRLEEAEKKAGITGEELNKQVENGTVAYEDMTDAQKEVYKAYLDNEKKQKELEESTKALTDAKKKETLASFDNQLALAKESGNYDDYKKSVIDAFKAGEISADEARDMIEKSMSEMSDSSQKTFMEDLPSDISDGLDPHKYESTGTKLKKWFSNTWTDIKKTFSDAATVVADSVSKAFSKAINWVLDKAIKIINGFIGAINAAIGVINLIPGVSISKLTKLEVPKMAKGGVVNSATLAMFGEAGKEAVIPLENNTEWMDILADRINQRSNTPSKIVLMLDKKEFGWANINSINDITKQTGALQLSLA